MSRLYSHRHGVVLPYNHWSERQWRDACAALGLIPTRYLTDIGLYPRFARPIFETGLHFIAELAPMTAGSAGLLSRSVRPDRA